MPKHRSKKKVKNAVLTLPGILATWCQPSRCLKTFRWASVHIFSLFNRAFWGRLKDTASLDLFLCLSWPPPPLIPSLYSSFHPPPKVHKSECFHCCWNHNLWVFHLTRAFPSSIIESTAAGYPGKRGKKKKNKANEPFPSFWSPSRLVTSKEGRIIWKRPEHILENRKITHSNP